MQQIESSVVVYLTWDDDAGKWRYDPVDLAGTGLDWKTPPHIVDPETGYKMQPADDHTLTAFDRANGDVTIDDLADMLGVGVIDQHMRNGAIIPPNSDRPISRGMIDVIDNLLESAFRDHKVDDHAELQATIRARLLPIFASVYDNAVQRTKAARR